jgi:hypothetical protein
MDGAQPLTEQEKAFHNQGCGNRVSSTEYGLPNRSHLYPREQRESEYVNQASFVDLSTVPVMKEKKGWLVVSSAVLCSQALGLGHLHM